MKPANKFAVPQNDSAELILQNRKKHEEPRIHSQAPNSPRLIFFELTKRCNLGCVHCRASAGKEPLPGEMTTEEVFRFIDDVAAHYEPIMVLTGGEPLYRPDIFEIIDHTIAAGLKVALATNGTLITPEIARRIKESGVTRVAISLDGSNAKTHDSFRKQEGAFDQALRGIKYLRDQGVGVQINTTISKHNLAEVPAIYELAQKVGAEAFHIFLLVPVGCGLTIAKEKEITPEQYEEVLNWFYDREQEGKIELKATCAPHYYRIRLQRAAAEGKKVHPARGCLAGSAVCFVSHKGDVQPCGYLPLLAGNVRQESFKDIWEKASLFESLRDPARLKGKCGECEYKVICEGCRARAYAAVGDYLEAEPFCTYQPLSPIDKKLLNELQFDFPLVANPYAAIAARARISEEETLRRVSNLKNNDLIRRIGPTFEGSKLGYVNTLVTIKVPAADLDRAGEMISRYPEVTHNYAREGEYNLWFTLTCASSEREREIISEIKDTLGCQEIYSLPALKKFKINARFAL